MYRRAIFAQASDLGFSSSDEAKESNKLSDELGAIYTVEEIVHSGVIEHDFIFPVIQRIHTFASDTPEIGSRESREINEDLGTVEVNDDGLNVRRAHQTKERKPKTLWEKSLKMHTVCSWPWQ